MKPNQPAVVKLSKGDMIHIQRSRDKTPVWVNATLRQIAQIEASRRQNGDFDAAVYATKYGYRD